ncbi:GDSL-type esterase/lipase family protein [Bacillus sp. 03113]|uniref:GDSL-type esterase/lipase family protein n=1 Tax=Bacillus sp. 03113 TaxID=2578211 RepID=UPI001144644F|nr:GDSL-type esterase/lipase family protein [Bacillus sp. 03113]
MKKREFLFCSLILNIVLITMAFVFIHQKGGLSHLKNMLGNTSTLHKNSISLVKEEAKTISSTKHHDVVFLGDSHTEYFEWGEYFLGITVSNQGIAGDTSKKLLERLNQVKAVTPKKIFLMIGINDLKKGLSVQQVSDYYKEIINVIIRDNPDVKLYTQSVLYVNRNKFPMYFKKNANKLNKKVQDLNKEIERLSNTRKNINYIDVNNVLQEKDELPGDLTVDGLHLNAKGYKKWTEHLSPYIKER